jgi:hypothetical protein
MRLNKIVSLPTQEYRDTLSILRSTTTTDPRAVEHRVHAVLFEIERALETRNPRALTAWAMSSSKSLDPADIGNLLRAGCTAVAKGVLRTDRGQFPKVTAFLQTAQRAAVVALKARREAIPTAASA